MIFGYAGWGCCEPQYWHEVICLPSCSCEWHVSTHKLIRAGFGSALLFHFKFVIVGEPSFKSKSRQVWISNFFPACSLQEDYNSWNFWKLPPPDIDVWGVEESSLLSLSLSRYGDSDFCHMVSSKIGEVNPDFSFSCNMSETLHVILSCRMTMLYVDILVANLTGRM